MNQPTGNTFLAIEVTEEGRALPSSVFREILTYLAAMAPEGFTGEAMGDVAEAFEHSVIAVGFTPDEAEDFINDEYNRQKYNVTLQCRPVAEWRSGDSTGCNQTLILHGDDTFEWTEP